MKKIYKLSVDEIKKIAAGEVVERPANLVKELVENSLDAGAGEITIYVEDGGKKLVRVVDNGAGMGFEDVHTAFEQHATSKIARVDDLQELTTFGFRGEALSSISSVSVVDITTKEALAQNGVTLKLSYGALEREEEASCSDGTSISIHDIFSNIPARKKFLKATETEWRQILLLFQAFVLANKEVHFKLFHDGKLVHNCPPVLDVKLRILQLWDQPMVDRVLDVNVSDEMVSFSCSGYVSDHQYARYNTAQIFLFVNARWIRNQKLIKAILRGYQNVLQSGKYPAAVLFITTDSSLIDVNIHPRKEEVQFIHAHKIEQLIQHAISKRLDKQIGVQLHGISVPGASYERTSFSSSPSYAFPQNIGISAEPGSLDVKKNFFDAGELLSSEISQSPTKGSYQDKQRVMIEQSYKIIGQVHKTYIILENDDGMLLIDQHAAHERILYEDFRKRFKQVETISLMFPQSILLDEHDIALLVKHYSLLVQYGIVGDQMGIDRFVVKSVPIYLKNANLIELIKEVVEIIRENERLDEELFSKMVRERIHAQMACKAAVKAGDELSLEKMQEIVNRLEHVENRLTCPHGRPTIWFIGISEIEKRFRRDYIK